jgi:hypothetical protein
MCARARTRQKIPAELDEDVGAALRALGKQVGGPDDPSLVSARWVFPVRVSGWV